MVRTNQPLVERITLVWHDWFATSNSGVGQQGLMLYQNRMLRRHAFGDYRTLLHAVTRDPAMLLWLSGVYNEKDSSNRRSDPAFATIGDSPRLAEVALQAGGRRFDPGTLHSRSELSGGAGPVEGVWGNREVSPASAQDSPAGGLAQ